MTGSYSNHLFLTKCCYLKFFIYLKNLNDLAHYCLVLCQYRHCMTVKINPLSILLRGPCKICFPNKFKYNKYEAI